MLRIVEPDPTAASMGSDHAEDFVSPDGRYLAFVASRGDIRTGKATYLVGLYDLEASRWPKKENRPRKYKILVRGSTDGPEDAIAQLRWSPDGRRLLFLMRSASGTMVLYTVDPKTSRLSRLSPANYDIASYDADLRDGVVVFVARVPRTKWSRAERYGYVLGHEDLRFLMVNSPAELRADMVIYVLHLGASPLPISGPHPLNGGPIRISPDGRSAVVEIQERDIPKKWLEYPFLASVKSELIPSDANSMMVHLNPAVAGGEALGLIAPVVSRYYLVGLRTHAIRPLLDAPQPGMELSLPAAQWTSNSAVILRDAFVPLDSKDDLEISSGKASLVIDLAAGSLRLAPATVADNSDKPDVAIVQSPDSAPEFKLRRSEDSPWVVISDLNPQLRALWMGKVEEIHWKEKDGKTLVGGLILPHGYLSGQKYPLVIQTHGFNDHAFLVDGPYGVPTAFAARALAGRGIAVLQLNEDQVMFGPDTRDRGADFDQSGENPRFARLMESAVGELARRGLVDPNRVGIIGWSRTSMNVAYALAFSKMKFAAATLSDGIAATPFCYVSMYGLAPYPGMAEFEGRSPSWVIGAQPWGEGIKLWEERSYWFHLDKIQTPIRFERMGTSPPCQWDIYAVMSRHGAPVEFVHIRNDSHILHTPWGRLTSQGGNVDWFDFWLNGHEDSDHDKRGQYTRWEHLCDLQRSRNPTRPTFCIPSRLN